MILNSTVMTRHYILAGIVVACLMLIFIGLARIILDLVYGQPSEPSLPKRENVLMNAGIILAAGGLIGLGFWMPSGLHRVLTEAVALVGGK